MRPSHEGRDPVDRASLPSVNPLQKARDGAASTWRKSRDGTKRTASWVKDGVGGAVGKARSRGGEATSGIQDAVSNAGDRSGGASLLQRAKADSRIGAALILGVLLLVTWIAWTVYVWSENGVSAGLGVLISWPAVIAAIALIAAPFVAAVILVRRMAADREPALAGGAVPATAEPEQKQEASGSDDSEAREEDDSEEDDAEDQESEEEKDAEEEGSAAA